MKHSKLLSIGTLSIILIFSSCKKDEKMEPANPSSGPVVVTDTSECNEYIPTLASNVINANWSVANENDEYIDEIVIPNDAGGGYVKVTLTQPDTNLRPYMSIYKYGAGGAIISGSSVQTNNELNRIAYFSVHPGEKYTINVRPFVNASNYPVNYKLEWEFISRVDCFEPNDVQADAKRILLNEAIEAYAIAGYKGNYIGSYDDQTYDWYKVVIDDTRQLVVEMEDVPNDMRIVLRLFNANGSTIPINHEWLGNATNSNRGRLSKVTSSSNVAPGTYYIELHADYLLSRKSNNDLYGVPEHFNKKYKLKAYTL